MPKQASGLGAQIINDVSGLRGDPELAEVVRAQACRVGADADARHTQHDAGRAFRPEVMTDVTSGLRAALGRATRASVPKSRIVIDPGIGFGKRYRQNFEILARLPELAKLGYPLLVGTSRKTFLGRTLAKKDAAGKLSEHAWPPEKRLWGTAATLTAAILGGAHIVRVHDVAEMLQVAR